MAWQELKSMWSAARGNAGESAREARAYRAPQGGGVSRGTFVDAAEDEGRRVDKGWEAARAMWSSF